MGQDLKTNRKSLQPEMLTPKLNSRKALLVSHSRETPSNNLERTFDVVHESRGSSFADANTSNFNVASSSKDRMAKAASCSLLDKIESEAESFQPLPIPAAAQSPGGGTAGHIETSSPVVSPKTLQFPSQKD